jgi:acetyltransferase-like isoleucine patch superfamily enzyme
MIEPADLLAALRAVQREREAEIRQRWNRAVPFGDLVTDRWERARALGFGEGASIYDSALVIGDVRVGERTWIGPSTVLDGSGGLTIGSTCSISAGVQIYSHDTVKWAVSGGVAPYERAPVAIGDHTYIGPLSVVTKGVTIGRHCVIGTHSIVNRSIPDYSIAFGAACRVVGRVVVGEGGAVQLVYDDATAGPQTRRDA